MIADGTGKPLFNGCVAVLGNRIADVYRIPFPMVNADKVINAENAILSPGFIDAHAHSDISILAAPEATGKITQGITTEIIGNCGLSVFPLTEKNRDHIRELYAQYNVDITWNSFAQYADLLDTIVPALNIISLCGHNTLRAAYNGYGRNTLDTGVKRRMNDCLSSGLQDGAGGFSTGLLYVPGIFADQDELHGFAGRTAEYAKVWATHLRSEGRELIEAADEFLKTAQSAGCQAHISHAKCAGKQNWHKIDDFLLRFTQNDLTGDCYPYTESMTQLSAYMPSPYSEMSDTELKEKLHNAAFYAEFVNTLDESFTEDDWHSKRIVSTPPDLMPQSLAGETILFIAQKLKTSPPELCAALLKAAAPSVTGASAGISKENLLRIARLPNTCCGTDESARPANFSIGRSHPRGFNSFPEFIRLLRPYMSVENIIRKITALPAGIFKVPLRGFIKKGFVADLTLIDLNAIYADSGADFSNPHKISAGIKRVCVNGKTAYCAETPDKINRAGQALRL